MRKDGKATPETRKKQSIVKIGRKRKPFSEETRRKMAYNAKHRVISKERREKQSNTLKQRYQEGIIVPHNKIHFDPIESKQYRSWQKNQWHSRKKKAEGTHTYAEWELLKKQYGYKCPCCKKVEPKITLTEDHIIPLSKGGSNYIENIQPLCKSCNCSKHTKIIRY